MRNSRNSNVIVQYLLSVFGGYSAVYRCVIYCLLYLYNSTSKTRCAHFLIFPEVCGISASVYRCLTSRENLNLSNCHIFILQLIM